MRPNIVTEAGLSTRFNQWWSSIPFVTSGVVIISGIIYLVCLLVGYDSFAEICFLPTDVVSRFQVYRIYSSVVFHGSLLHVVFNMLALIPLGTELERITGSIRLLYLMLLLATSNAIFHIIIALLALYNPISHYPVLMNECAIGFSGIIFSMIVMETSLSGAQSRSVFGLFNVPAKWYVWILLILFQLLASNVSLLGHLCGILSGFAYTYGLFNFLLPGSSFYSSIESSSLLSSCVRRPGFILCTGGPAYGQLPTHTTVNTAPSALFSGSTWRNLSSWLPQQETAEQPAGPTQDPRFPGRGRTLVSSRNQTEAADTTESGLQTRLLDDLASGHNLERATMGTEYRISDARHPAADIGVVDRPASNEQDVDSFEEDLKKLVAMGFEKTQAEVALAAADGDPTVAIEILMSQQG